jgi:ABC-type transport system involved in multi-copper enzyme maturation permease subunit
VTTTMQKPLRLRPSWLSRFWAVVRYEMLWNIRKKKFIGIVIIAFVFSTISLFVPVVVSNLSGGSITANPDNAVFLNAGSFTFFLFALVTAMNSISGEFESGSIVPLLTKPVSRTMVFLGKLFAAFIIIFVTYSILFVYTTVGSIFVYGPQNNLHLIPLALVGNVITTFVWVAIILAMGSISKNTMITAIIAFGLFIGLLVGVQIVPQIAGPTPALNYLPGTGALGTMNVTQGSNLTAASIYAGTDNLGINLVYFVLYPSANIDFIKTSYSIQNGTSAQLGTSVQFTQSIAYTEPLSLVTLRSAGVAFAYIVVFLFIAWYAFRRAQILE